MSKKVNFTDGTAESSLPLEYVDEFYNEYHGNGNPDAVVDYFFNVLCKGAEKKKSELLRLRFLVVSYEISKKAAGASSITFKGVAFQVKSNTCYKDGRWWEVRKYKNQLKILS